MKCLDLMAYLDSWVMKRKTPWPLELGVGEEQWRRKRSGLHTAACLRESDP
jgi:hypothetical protein